MVLGGAGGGGKMYKEQAHERRPVTQQSCFLAEVCEQLSKGLHHEQSSLSSELTEAEGPVWYFFLP